MFTIHLLTTQDCLSTDTPCPYPSSGYTCCPSSTTCLTSGAQVGTCVSFTPPTSTCPTTQICIPDPVKAPNAALCCAPEEACTSSGCQYLHPHFCPNHHNCGVSGRCVKDNQCCPAQCVVDYGAPIDSLWPPTCCAAGGYCTPFGCWYVGGWNCDGKFCGSDGSWTCAEGACCKRDRACGVGQGTVCCGAGEVCVNGTKGKCCPTGQIESPKGACCLREQINADGDCCGDGSVPEGHWCAPLN